MEDGRGRRQALMMVASVSGASIGGTPAGAVTGGNGIYTAAVLFRAARHWHDQRAAVGSPHRPGTLWLRPGRILRRRHGPCLPGDRGAVRRALDNRPDHRSRVPHPHSGSHAEGSLSLQRHRRRRVDERVRRGVGAGLGLPRPRADERRRRLRGSVCPGAGWEGGTPILGSATAGAGEGLVQKDPARSAPCTIPVTSTRWTSSPRSASHSTPRRRTCSAPSSPAGGRSRRVAVGLLPDDLRRRAAARHPRL